MPIIDTPAGTLEVTNAVLRASEFRATQKIGVANNAPTKNFSVGTKFHVDAASIDPVNITGNVVATGMKIGNLTISPTFDLAAVSNVGNTTSNTLQFANATTGFVTTSNIEIGGNISLTSNAQVKVDSNVVAEYTGPHPRQPTEVPLKKYPEIAFDASKFDRNDTTNTYVQAGYTVTASIQNNATTNAAYGAFDGVSNDNNARWRTTNLYVDNSSTADPSALDPSSPQTRLDTNTSIGEYLILNIPKKIKLKNIVVNAPHMHMPYEVDIYGRNEGVSTWTHVKNYTYTVPSGTYIGVYNITNQTIDATDYYSEYAFVVVKTNGHVGAAIGELELHGYEEDPPAGDTSLDTTLKSRYNLPETGDYAMYFDGKYFVPGDGGTSNNLVSGSGVSVIHHNATYDTTEKYWTLDGSTESNVTTGSLGLVGDAPHTVSTWFNASNLEANATTQQLFSLGSGYSEEIVRVDDTQISANTWHNLTYAYQGEGGSKVTYVDGRKVAEAQVEDTFGNYPPFAMAGYSQGGYCASASSEAAGGNRPPWKAFNNTTSGTFQAWGTDLGFTSGVYSSGGSSFTLNGSSQSGHWLKLELPHRIYPSYVTILTHASNTTFRPTSGFLIGSNDDEDWDVLNQYSALSYTSGIATLTSQNTNKAYKYILLLIQTLDTNTGTYAFIENFDIYGHKEGDLTRFPEPTRVLKYPHVTMTGPAQRGYVASASSLYLSSGQAIYPGWEAFDHNNSSSNRWASENAQNYNGGSFLYSGNKNLGTNNGGSGTPNGEWLMIEMPHKLKLQSTKIFANGNALEVPDKFIIYGSNNLTGVWSVVDNTYETTSAAIPYSGTGKTWTVSTSASPVAYKYFGLVVRNTTGSTYITTVNQWELFGTEENTGTPAIVGGPFAGKVANFRVYDQYLGDERIQEIYDAQKDEFGHKKSSMTLYKGRVGVGTTEPEGALTVVDEPHALAKFPARAVSANDSYVEGDGRIQLSAAHGTGYSAFDGLTSTSWDSTPTRNTRVSEEVDFGAWLKIQTPESVSLKKAEIESNPYWAQVGTTINDNAEYAASTSSFGMALDCSDDGTRIIVGAYAADVTGSNRGQAFVFDWNGSDWVKVGNTLQGTQNDELLGYAVAISGDGNYIALGSSNYHTATHDDAGRYGVFNLVGSTWTILPDAGALTSTTVGETDYFIGAATNARAGWSLSLSHDGKTIAAGYRDLSPGGEIRVHTYTNGVWGLKGQSLLGTESSDRLGQNVKMSPDGNYLIAGAPYGAKSEVYVYDYNSSTSQWVKRTTLTHPTLPNANTHFYGSGIAISDDGNTVAVGASGDDTGGTDYGKAYIYSWSGSAWTLVSTLTNPLQGTNSESFGTAVDLSGDGTRLVVAAAYENVAQGYAFTFEYNGGSWGLRDYTNIGSGGLPTNNGRLGEFYTGLIISRDGSTIVGGDRAGSANGKARVWNMPSNIKSIWGSNDDVNWTKITTGNKTFRGNDRLEFKNLDNPNYYKYHAIVADAFTRLKEVKLYGIRNQGSSTLHDGALTLTKKVTAPQLESTGILNMKGDYTEIRANSNVVTEFNRSKKLIKYPRVALTGPNDGSGYVVTQNAAGTWDLSSPTNNRNAWALFDGISMEKSGHAGPHLITSGAASRYNADGTYAGSDSLGGVSGDWVSIRLPEKIKIEFLNLWQRIVLRTPTDATVLGSLDGQNWNIIDSWNNYTSFVAGKSTRFTINANEYYDYIGFVFEKIGVNASGLYNNFFELELFGTPENDPEAHGVDVTVKSLPNVPNTDWLDVYYDGQDYTSMPVTVTDKSGNNHTGTPSGVGFDTGYKAFTFDGMNDYIVKTGLPTPTGAGNFRHTVSMWFKLDSLAEAIILWGLAGETDGTDGSPSSSSLPHSTIGTNGIISWAFWANDISNQTAVVINRWYHCVWTYSGGTSGRRMFLDGVEQVLSAQTTALNMVNSTSRLAIGIYPHNLASNPFDGSIANFRLFNRALTSDEIYQLYAYQKEYFGHGVLGMTLKAGRLGIGTSEPKATLDIRGDVMIDGYRLTSMYPGFASGGDDVYDVDGYRIHAFTNSGTFTVPGKNISADVLVVGGGGGGGQDNAGGGGAGGLIFKPHHTFAGRGISGGRDGAYIITIGSGGAGSPDQNATAAQPGGDTTIKHLVEAHATSASYSFDAITNIFTGKGGGPGNNGGSAQVGSLNGGSGGGQDGEVNKGVAGGTATQPGQSGDSGTYGYGNNGGTSNSSDAGGGGGGAGSTSATPTGTIGGIGGNGLSGAGGYDFIEIYGTRYGEVVDETVYFAGGGAGGNRNSVTSSFPRGGLGGGGTAGGTSSTNENGLPGTGGGGAGAFWGSQQINVWGGNGGSGIVIIRYKL